MEMCDDISIASFVDPTSNGLSRVFRTFLPSPSEMIANDRWFNHFLSLFKTNRHRFVAIWAGSNHSRYTEQGIVRLLTFMLRILKV